MNYSISGALIFITGFITTTVLTITAFVYERFILQQSSGRSNIKIAFEEFPLIYTFSILLIIVGITMIIYDLYLHFNKSSK